MNGHGVGVGVEGFGEALLGLLQAGFGVLAVGDVKGSAGDADEVALAVALRLDNQVVPS